VNQNQNKNKNKKQNQLYCQETSVGL